MALPSWKLPPGVARGTWDYFQSPTIANDYDDYFAGNTLFDYDEQVLREEFSEPGLVADLGCGTGRAVVPLVRAGHRGLAIDMSPHMLAVVREKAEAENLPITCLEANLVELDAVTDGTVTDGSVDYAMCLFNTLGMIRGRSNRQQMLRHVRRIVRPGGKFVLHIHNFWFNLYDPGGPWWVLKSLATAPFGKDWEVGDKVYPYRGLPNMFLHVFRPSEIRRDLQAAGWNVRRWTPIDVARRHPLKGAWLLPTLRANGWIIVCE